MRVTGSGVAVPDHLAAVVHRVRFGTHAAETPEARHARRRRPRERRLADDLACVGDELRDAKAEVDHTARLRPQNAC
jgi:hypothetical protein